MEKERTGQERGEVDKKNMAITYLHHTYKLPHTYITHTNCHILFGDGTDC